jgi:ATP-dependent RNA helicase SUPV3L1/SUV3
MADGTFGTTAHVGDIDAETVEAVEAHRFDPVERIAWRNPDLDFKSPGDLLKSLEVAPPNPELAKGRDADDYNALRALARDPEIADMAATPADVRLLWDVCQVPDFRKVMSDQHARLLAQIYKGLMRDGCLSGDWVGRQIDRLDRTDGDIDSLIGRIAHIRTWTFITHRADWVADSQHWQARARAIEDRLSDALHDGLTQRFVDRRTAALVKRMSEGSDLIGAVRRNGEVLVEGEYVGKLDGFAFTLDADAPGSDTRPLLTAARKALSGEIPGRVKALEGDNDGSFTLDAGGGIRWRGQPVAEMVPGPDALRPQVRVYDTDFLDGALRERIRKRLAGWLSRHTRNRLAALFALAEADLPPRPRGLAFQLVEAMGVLRRAEVAEHVKALTKHERKLLRQHGVRLGHECVWVPAALKPKADRMKALLTAVHRGDDPRALPDADGPAFRPTARTDEALCRVLGYRRIEPPRRGRGNDPDEVVAVRVDVLEQLAAALSKLRPSGPFTPVAPLTDLLADDREALALALPALGYARSGGADPETPQAFRPWRGGARQVAPAGKPSGQRRRKRKAGGKSDQANVKAESQHDVDATAPSRKKQGRKSAPARQQAKRRTRPDPDHPFAKLQEITFRE